MIKFRTALAVTAALIAAPALAQQAAPAAAPQTAPAAPATAPTAPAAAGFTDAEVTSFARAALAVDKVNKDTAIPAADKGKRLADAVTGAGLAPERYNAIATAQSSDTALQKRIQDALVAEQQAAAPAAAAPATAPAATPTPAASPTPATPR
jgi:hypothetical protein